ncbi:sensor histidine kinase [Actinoplanes sp. NPDC024001]|uniref:sensor histidine kinase n=1 Tax=Actinoplanes sp. NPDC024001 TaxID=3154598 RepID=UPI0033E1B9FF
MPVPSLLVQRLGPAPRRAIDLIVAASAGLLSWFAAVDTGGPGRRAVLVALALGVPLVVRRRWPGATALVVGAAAGAVLLAGIVPDFASPALMLSVGVALHTVGRQVPGRRGAAFALVASVPLVIGLSFGGGTADAPGPAGVAFGALVCGASWAIGWTLRERRRHAEQTAAQSTARAVAEERLRIAREMHDAVGHSLSLIAVKAAVANHVARQRPEEATAALEVIESESRSALAELRRTVGALRTEPDYGVPPTLSDLSGLADRAESAGVRVRLDVRGGTDLPEPVALAAYRIVQESLTNVVRHAAPAACRVEVESSGDRLRIEVTDDGTRRPPPSADGTGLAGMRERVAAHGGTFSAGPRSGGGFAVVAVLPYGPVS